MQRSNATTGPPRTPLSRARVLGAALDLADAEGADGLTIRALAEALGVKPMALYHHVENKDAILDGVVDLVFAEIDLPGPTGASWAAELRRRAESMRTVLGRHRWAIGLMESRRAPGPATLRHHDAVIGLLRAAGFSYPDIAHAVAFLDAFVYGFALQEAMLPFDGTDQVHELAEEILAAMPVDDYPHFVEFAREHVLQPGYDFSAEFDVGLRLVLHSIAGLPTAPKS